MMTMSKKVVKGILAIVLWPLAELLARCRIRFLHGGNTLTRIGHLALDPDVYVKAGLLGWRPAYRGVLLAPGGRVVNPCLLRHWERYLTIIRHPVLTALLAPLARMPQLRYDLSVLHLADGQRVKILPAVYRVQQAYEHAYAGQPLLRLSLEEEARGRQQLRELGLPPQAWFVCLHVRESGYLPERAYHSYRNADIMTYLPAVDAIVARGGWVIRMGDPSMKRLPRMPGVVDYVHSGLQRDWMDIFCFARCRFFLGDTSGPFVAAFAFGVPCAVANQIPMGHGAYSARDLWMPKRYRSLREHRELTFAEVLRSPWRSLGRTADYEAAGIGWVDNHPEEIRELAVEMLDRLEGRLSSSADDETLQQRFQSLLQLKPAWGTTARVGREFLRRHEDLLEDQPASCASFGAVPSDSEAATAVEPPV